MIAMLLGILSAVFYVIWFSTQSEKSAIVQLPCSNIMVGCGNAKIKINADRQPQVMRAFKLKVTSVPASQIYVDFAMAGMSMGLNRYKLIQQADGHWQSEVILPLCVQGRSDWLMEVTVSTSAVGFSSNVEKRYRLVFQATK